MTRNPEPFLQIRRHVGCCNQTFTDNRYPTDACTPEAAEWQSIANVDAWAKHHRMTCHALKVTDDVAP